MRTPPRERHTGKQWKNTGSSAQVNKESVAVVRLDVKKAYDVERRAPDQVALDQY